MPRYVYQCEECEVTFQAVHSIKERLIDCDGCSTENSLKRIPMIPLVLNKGSNSQKQEAGALVKEYIEDATEDLRQEKKELSDQLYKEKDD